MTYRVLNDTDVDDYNPNKEATRWADRVEGALRYFEGQGFLLVAIHPGNDTEGPVLVLHRE